MGSKVGRYFSTMHRTFRGDAPRTVPEIYFGNRAGSIYPPRETTFFLMSASTQSVLNQLDELMFNYDIPDLPDSLADSASSMRDNESIHTNSTSFYEPSRNNSLKNALGEPFHYTKPTLRRFREELSLTQLGTDNMSNILECMRDMLIQENDQIEQALADLIHDIGVLVPMNTVLVPVLTHH